MTFNKTLKRGWLTLSWAFVALTVVLVSGCARKPASTQGPAHDFEFGARERDDVYQAMEYLFHMHEYDPRQAGERIVYHLNQWMQRARYEKPEGFVWQIDPLYLRMTGFEDLKRAYDLSSTEFQRADVYEMEVAAWSRGVARWATAQPLTDPALAAWLSARRGALPAEQYENLATTLKLFDWTVRNIALVEEGQVSAGPAGDEAAGGDRRSSIDLYAAREVMLLGRGSPQHRAEVFLSLLRQRGIDGAVLGFGESREEAQRDPQIVIVIVGDQLYLFDMKVGLPLPGPDGRGVATWKMLKANPELVRQWDVADLPPYFLSAELLPRARALIYGTASQLSQRMKLLEQRLYGDQKLVLTAAPANIRQALSQRGLADDANTRRAALWKFPYTVMKRRLDRYRELAKRSRDSDQPVIVNADMRVFDASVRYGHIPLPPLYRARLMHLRGLWEDRGNRRGAKVYYLIARPADYKIFAFLFDHWDLDDSKQVEGLFVRADSLLLLRGESLIENFTNPMEVRYVKMPLPRHLKARRHATLWLGLLMYDDGHHDMAREFFDGRLLQAEPESLWTPAARYNLARALEWLAHTERGEQQVAEQQLALITAAAMSPPATGAVAMAAPAVGEAVEQARGDAPSARRARAYLNRAAELYREEAVPDRRGRLLRAARLVDSP